MCKDYIPVRKPSRSVSGPVGLLLAAACWQTPLNAATETATVSANIISTIALTNQSDMVFGDIASSNAPGTVVLSPSGALNSSGGATINSTVSGGPAVFDVRGDPNAVYVITLPASVVMTAPAGSTMVVDRFTSMPGNEGLTDSGGQQVLFIGGTLNVGSNQVFGSYIGTMSVTVEFN